MVLVSPADADGSLDAEVLRLRHRRLGLTLVLPHGLHRPARPRGRPLPQERRGPVVHLFLERVLTRWRAAAPSEARVAAAIPHRAEKTKTHHFGGASSQAPPDREPPARS